MKTIQAILAASVVFLAGNAQAATTLTVTPADLLGQAQAQAQDQFNALSDDLSAGIWMNPSNSAEAHSAGFIPVGFQVGVEVAALTIDPTAAHWANMNADLPEALPFPRLRISAGIPFGLDLSYMTLSMPDSNIEMTGYEGRFALGSFIPVPMVEANIRYHQSSLTGVQDYEIKNAGFAVMIGANFPIIKPYAEFGTVTSTATPSGQLVSGPVVLQEYESTKSTTAIGAKIELAFFVINVEQSTVGDQKLTTAKIGFEF